MRSVKFVIAMLALCLAPASLPAASLLTNGSLEEPNVEPIGTFDDFAVGADIAGWTVVGAGSVSLVDGSFTQSGFTFPAQDGDQALDVTGFNSNSSTGIQQSVATTPGTEYVLSFWVGNVVNPGGAFGTTSTINVLVNGGALDAATNSNGAGETALNWQQFTREFTADSATTTIQLLNGDGSGDFSNFVDNIAVEAGDVAPTPIPLPAAAMQVTTLIGAFATIRSARAGLRAWRDRRMAGS